MYIITYAVYQKRMVQWHPKIIMPVMNVVRYEIYYM